MKRRDFIKATGIGVAGAAIALDLLGPCRFTSSSVAVGGESGCVGTMMARTFRIVSLSTSGALPIREPTLAS